MARAFHRHGGEVADQTGPEPAFVRRLVNFARLEPSDGDAICAILGRPVEFPVNGDLVVEGVPTTSNYVIERGWACSYKLLRDGRRQILGFLLPGDYTAVAEVISGCPTCSVLALTPVLARPCQIAGLGALREESAHFRQALDRALQLDIATLRDHLVNIGRRNAYQRLAYLILELHFRLRLVGRADEAAFDMPITQEMVADALGLSNVHVNRTLRRLSMDSIACLTGGRLTIGDWEALAAIADFHETYLGQFAREHSIDRWRLEKSQEPLYPSSSMFASGRAGA